MTLTLLQGVVTIVCLTTMKRLRYIDYPAFEWSVARKVAPLSFVFIAYVVISLIRCGRRGAPVSTGRVAGAHLVTQTTTARARRPACLRRLRGCATIRRGPCLPAVWAA